MAQGGEITAKDESRPMPDETFHDKMDVNQQHEDPHAAAYNFVSQMRSDIDNAKSPEEMVMLHQRYALGGAVEANPKTPISEFEAANERDDNLEEKEMPSAYSLGGAVEENPKTHISTKEDKMERDEDMEEEEMPSAYSHGGSIADRIMSKKAKAYADGGEVDLSENADEEPNNEDDMSFNALRKENYSESPALSELDYDTDKSIGDDFDDRDKSDQHDMVSIIRRKMKSKV